MHGNAGYCHCAEFHCLNAALLCPSPAMLCYATDAVLCYALLCPSSPAADASLPSHTSSQLCPPYFLFVFRICICILLYLHFLAVLRIFICHLFLYLVFVICRCLSPFANLKPAVPMLACILYLYFVVQTIVSLPNLDIPWCLFGIKTMPELRAVQTRCIPLTCLYISFKLAKLTHL